MSGDCDKCGTHPVDGGCGCHTTDTAIDAGTTGMDVDCGDCRCSRCVETRAYFPGLGAFEYRTWRKWMAIERRRVGHTLGNKGCARREKRFTNKAFKRLSAMRRQGKWR